MNTKKVSATNVRVNLTEVISTLDASNRVAITKHGKVVAYLVAHVEEEVATDHISVEEPQQTVESPEEALEELNIFLEEEDEGEPDSSLDDLEFEDYINDLRHQTMALGFTSS